MPSNRRGKIASSGTQFAASLFCSFDILPSCGHFRGCRAKHQKLKTGSDQSPGDKKTEAESDQSKLNTVLRNVGCRVPQYNRYLVCFLFHCYQLICFTVVPNGPAEPDSEPANQMSWKEGRQLLRK